MFDINIISKVEMKPINEAAIKQLIIDQIAKQQPDVHVNSINFVQRRDPARIEAVVDAQLGKPTEPVKEEAPFALVVPEEKEPKAPEEVNGPGPEKVESVADIFNMPS